MKEFIYTKMLSYLMKSHKYVIPNAFFGLIECDIFSVTNSEYSYEFEIKISRSDFFADKRKYDKHNRFSDCFKNIKKEGFIPNRFYYVCPVDLIKIDEIPEYAGLVYIKDGLVVFIKNAPFLHKEKINEKIYMQLMDKCYYRYIYKYQKFSKKILKQTDNHI